MKYITEKFGRKIVLDTDLIAGLPELTHQEFMDQTDCNKDDTLLDNNILIGIGPEVKESDMENILENRGAYETGNTFLVYWSDDIQDEKQAIYLADTQWMIVFAWDRDQKAYVPKHILHKSAYTGGK